MYRNLIFLTEIAAQDAQIQKQQEQLGKQQQRIDRQHILIDGLKEIVCRTNAQASVCKEKQ